MKTELTPNLVKFQRYYSRPLDFDRLDRALDNRLLDAITAYNRAKEKELSPLMKKAQLEEGYRPEMESIAYHFLGLPYEDNETERNKIKKMVESFISKKAHSNKLKGILLEISDTNNFSMLLPGMLSPMGPLNPPITASLVEIKKHFSPLERKLPLVEDIYSFVQSMGYRPSYLKLFSQYAPKRLETKKEVKQWHDLQKSIYPLALYLSEKHDWNKDMTA